MMKIVNTILKYFTWTLIALVLIYATYKFFTLFDFTSWGLGFAAGFGAALLLQIQSNKKK